MGRRTATILAALALALVLAGGFQPFYLRFLLPEYAGMRQYFVALPFRQTPGLREFMLGVRERTHEGDRIAFWAPYRQWNRGYSFTFMRSAYVLGGRYLLPLVDERDEFLPHNLGEAEWLATYEGEPPLPGFSPVWRHPNGTLWRRSE